MQSFYQQYANGPLDRHFPDLKHHPKFQTRAQATEQTIEVITPQSTCILSGERFNSMLLQCFIHTGKVSKFSPPSSP
jgi:hypothetical protein